jgi:hypothetical protein
LGFGFRIEHHAEAKTQNRKSKMELLWLGYDGLSIRFVNVAAVLLYHPSLDMHIVRAYGHVPANIRAVVVTGDGVFLPSSWTAAQIRQRWARWRMRQA